VNKAYVDEKKAKQVSDHPGSFFHSNHEFILVLKATKDSAVEMANKTEKANKEKATKEVAAKIQKEKDDKTAVAKVLFTIRE